MKLKFNSKLLQAKQEAYLRQHPEEGLPDSFFRDLLDDQLGRGYLNRMPPAADWVLGSAGLRGSFGWLRFQRLPIRPGREEENTLLESWQSVLSACHTMQLRIAFVLLRRKGRSEIYLGAAAEDGNCARAAQQLRQCMAIHMAGAELEAPEQDGELEDALENYTHAGVVTGIPSLRCEKSGVTLQSLDKLARGLRLDGHESNYALVVLADPANDGEIIALTQKMIELKSEIHQYVGFSGAESFGTGESTYRGLNANLALGTILEAVKLSSLVSGNPIAGTNIGLNTGSTKNFNTNSIVTREYRDFTAKYCEDLIDRNIARLESGRNLGFWQTGVYVLSEDDTATDSVLGMLRSVYSGKDSYIEPIRVFNAGANPTVSDFVGRLQFLPLPECGDASKKEIAAELGIETGWHVLGRMYESFTTAMTTEELSIASSLPRREVPGLRLVKNAVAFANNSTELSKNAIDLGRLMDMGVMQQAHYYIDPDALVRHILVCGITGSGKSTTCKRLIQGVRARDIPVMIVEPAKDDYVRWAIEQNKKLPEEKQYRIFMPGVKEIEGVKPEPLQLFLFQPATWKHSPVNLVQHAEAAATLLNACLPSEDVIPVIIEEAVHATLEEAAEIFQVDLSRVENDPLTVYPTVGDLIAVGNRVIERKTYESRTKENFKEILNTRFQYLKRGTRGQILGGMWNGGPSFEELFDRPVVVNLSRLAGSKDKSLIMSLLLLALQEYRVSRYQYDKEYRARAQKNELQHLVVLEEAHNVLLRPKPSMSSGGDPQAAAAELFGNMLSEIRSYGQGMMIVDQVPTRLIEDAVKNTNYKIVHRMIAPDDVQLMASAMMLRADQAEIIPSLEIGNAVICGDMDDAASWVKINRT